MKCDINSLYYLLFITTLGPKDQVLQNEIIIASAFFTF